MTRRSDEEWETYSDLDVIKTCQLIQRTLAENGIPVPLGIVALYKVLELAELALELEDQTIFNPNPH